MEHEMRALAADRAAAAEHEVSAIRDGIPSAHTPGPWAITSISRETGAIGIGKDRILIAEAHNGYSFWDVMNGNEPREQLANARLISAAPDLLVALKMLVSNINEFGAVTDGEFIGCAESAILKATGHDRASD